MMQMIKSHVDLESRLDFEPDAVVPRRMLRACPFYTPTPLSRLERLSGPAVIIKDETNRMGLGSFKALGGVYAVARLILGRCENSTQVLSEPVRLTKPCVRDVARSMTFVCASAGNHGLAVAAGGRVFGAKARIHLSHAVPTGFEKRLRSQNAEVVRSGETYEESINAAIADSEQTGAILLADGSWPGYVEPPSLVMEGYTVIAEELRDEFETKKEWPTHVFLQAGVGGLAAAMAHMIRKTWSVQPRIHIVEPETAACLAASHANNRPTRVDGAASNMGRLDCKEPSILAHAILQRCDVDFMTVSDQEAVAAVDVLGASGPCTTPSGAAGFAAIIQLQRSGNICSADRPLAIVTEGQI